MMRSIFVLAFALSAVVAHAIAAEHEAEPKAAETAPTHSAVQALEVVPVEGIARHLRALQLVQDRMVSGNVRAVDAQRALLGQMIAELETRAGLAGLTEREAENSLPMALLNGADPERVRAILGQSGIASKDAFLLGALAYAEGRVPEALTAFASVEEGKLQPIARAQFYLTKGVMLATSEPEKALKSFAKARLSAPGTLIEEAALRREALIEMAEPELFLPLVRSYLHRFSASPFASAFISQFAFSISDLDEKTQDTITKELDGLLAQARSQDRQNFYGILARSSLIGGNYALADFATERAVNEVTNPSQLLSARLYRSAFNIAGDDHAEAATELESLMRAPLQASDREILSAAISVARELRRWPYGQNKDAVKRSMTEFATPIGVAGEEADSPRVSSAEKLLEDTKVLSGAAP